MRTSRRTAISLEGVLLGLAILVVQLQACEGAKPTPSIRRK